jgi:hypothetical protein
MAHASFASDLAHAEPVEPALLDQRKARLQNLFAEIGPIPHHKIVIASHLTLSSHRSTF